MRRESGRRWDDVGDEGGRQGGRGRQRERAADIRGQDEREQGEAEGLPQGESPHARTHLVWAQEAERDAWVLRAHIRSSLVERMVGKDLQNS